MTSPTEAELALLWRLFIRPTEPLPSGSPLQAVLLGAQPGAGKTAAATRIHQAYQLVDIDGDAYRPLHPEFATTMAQDVYAMPSVTAPAVGRWIQMSVDDALRRRYPYLVHGTWRDPSVPLNGIQRAHEQGFETHAVAVAVPPTLSRLGLLTRFYEALDTSPRSARWTPLEAHETTVNALPTSVEALASSPLVTRLTVLSRAGEPLYPANSEPFPAATWTPTRASDARAAFDHEFQRALTGEEASAYLARYRAALEVHRQHTWTDPQARQAWKRVAQDREALRRDHGGLVARDDLQRWARRGETPEHVQPETLERRRDRTR